MFIAGLWVVVEIIVEVYHIWVIIVVGMIWVVGVVGGATIVIRELLVLMLVISLKFSSLNPILESLIIYFPEAALDLTLNLILINELGGVGG